MDISIVIPLLNEAESLPELCDWIKRVMNEHHYSYEVILIDDGSTDNSWEVIERLCHENSSIKGISFRRNYGKSAALNVGFEHTLGKVVFTMDADLQDSPDELPALYKMVTEENYDLVSGWKKKRYDPITKTVPTKLFNAVTRGFSGIKLHDFNCGLKAYKKEVVKQINVYGELHRYIPMLAKWNGFSRIGEKVVEHRARKYGTTKFGLERFIFGFLDLLSVTFITKFKKRPMHFFGSFGILSFFIGFLISAFILGRKVYDVYKHIPARPVTEQPLFYLALVGIVVGVQLFLAGYLAELISLDSNKKGDYQVEDMINLKA
ncbi:glycosyltransferase family 2 protein [Hyphobacterium sp. CCMP332]|nr:glycosyltransferase family 2 protein [Hyphobacterium sp. CCMP332]